LYNLTSIMQKKKITAKQDLQALTKI